MHCQLFISCSSGLRIPRYAVSRAKKISSPSESIPKAPVVDKRQEVLVGVLGQIERCYGKGSILKLGESPSMNVETFSSGSIIMDDILGGGYPKGRVIEIYGPESSGKTTLALHAIAEVQKLNGTAAFIDAEHALDPVYARNLGVRIDDLLVSQPDSGEMALDVVDQLVRSAAVDIVVVDSVAALVPRVELEGDMTDQQMGLQARLMSKALRKLTGSLSKSHTTVIFINQLRSKIGVIFGSPEVTSGGNALKFYSSVRVDVRKIETLKENLGVRVRVKVVKNKVAPPFRVTEFDIHFGSGIDKVGCVLDGAEQMKLVERKGAYYYTANGDTLGHGRTACLEVLRNNPAMLANMTQSVLNAQKAMRSLRIPSHAHGLYSCDDETEETLADVGGSHLAPETVAWLNNPHAKRFHSEDKIALIQLLY